MDFTIKKENLLGCISKCEQEADPKHVTAAFRVMRVITGKKGQVKFASVGEFCSVDTVAISDEIKEQGSFNVAPQRLRDIVNGMPDGKIRISMKGTRVTVSSGKRRANFENNTVDAYTIDDPGKNAQWLEMESRKLVAALKRVRGSAQWIDDTSKPTVMILIPTEAGLQAYGCTGYTLTIVDTNMRVDCERMKVPSKAADLLALMSEDDDKVRVIYTDSRIYLENCDTLVSAMVPEYGAMAQVDLILDMIRDTSHPRGPSFNVSKMRTGLKSVLAATGFASSNDKGSRGYQVRLHLGRNEISMRLNLSEADATDEFDPTQGPDDDAIQDLDVLVSSTLFDKVLSSLDGTDEVQSLLMSHGMMITFRSGGIISGFMTESELK